MALAMLCSCVPDHRDSNMPDSSVYFSDNAANKGVQSVLMYDVQSEVETTVYVHCAGLNAATSKVTAKVAEDYIEYYNKVNYTELKALPENCYTLTKSSDEIKGRTASFSIKFNVSDIVEFAKEEGVDINDYVLSLGLGSDNLPIATVKDTTSLGYYLVRPDLRNATLQIRSTELTPDGKMTITAELPFENSWNLTYDIEFGETEVDEILTTRGNLIPAKYVFAELPAGTVIENKEVKSMSPGTNKVEYAVTIPSVEWEPGKAYNYAFVFSNAKLNGIDIPIENPMATASLDNGVMEAIQVPYSVNHRWYHAEGFLNDEATHYRHKLEPYGLVPYPESEHKSYVWSPESTQNGYWRENIFDGTGRSWYAAWNNNGYGVDIALTGKLKAVIDMKKKQDVNGLEMWTRVEQPNGLGDVQVVEFYSLEDCHYVKDTPTIEYDANAITYLGTLDFNGRNHLGYLTLDPVNTQYLLVHFIEQINGRKGSIDCAEIIVYGR